MKPVIAQTRIQCFARLIAEMPLKMYSFTSEKTTWERVEALTPLVNKLYRGADTVTLSRGDVFRSATEDRPEMFAFKCIVWGYSRHMPGNNIKFLAPHLAEIGKRARERRVLKDRDAWWADYKDMKDMRSGVKGLGLSTWTKLLYFVEARICGYPALILDRTIREVVRDGLFQELNCLKPLTPANAARKYPCYLQAMDRLADRLSNQKGCTRITPDRLEMFLWLFGMNLKTS
jgi:hypothetical protein